MNLQFTRPEAFWLLLAAIALAALRLWPKPRRAMPTGTWPLWQEVLGQERLRQAWLRWRDRASLGVELLALLLAVAALADPIASQISNVGRPTNGRPVSGSLAENRYDITLPTINKISRPAETPGLANDARSAPPSPEPVTKSVAQACDPQTEPPAPRRREALIVRAGNAVEDAGETHLIAALRAAGLDVRRKPAETLGEDLAEETPAGVDLIVLSDVPVTALSTDSVGRLGVYVREGGGLLVLGGPNAFMPGGYAGSELERLLPVHSIRKDRPQAALALVLVIDCSESMEGRRIELAKEAARHAVDRLQAQDLVGVLAFEDRPEWIVPLGPCVDKAAVAERIGRIEAAGRTNLAPALTRAWLALHAAFAPRKHAIVLTDGLSHVDDFARIVREMGQSGISLSCVALGDEAAGPMLRDLARLGQGRYYECRDAGSVPQIFAVEALTAARRGIREGTVRVLGVSGHTPDSLDLAGLPALLGCDESELAEGGEAWLQSEEGDPVLAVRTIGQGRVAAFAADLEGRWSAAWLAWSGLEPFWSETARLVARQHLALQPIGADASDLTALAPFEPSVEAPPTAASDGSSLWPYLLAASLVLLAVDQVVRRVGQ